MWQFVIFLIGFGMSCVGGVSIIGYLNFLPAGMNFIDFILFAYKRPECYMLPIGIVVMILSMYKSPFSS